MSTRSWIIAALAAAGLFSPAAGAQQHNLQVSTYVITRHWLVSEAIEQWRKQLEEASGGRIRISVHATPVAQPRAHFDAAQDGLADITLGIPGYTPGRFVLAGVGGTPNAGNFSESLGGAYWRTIDKSPEMQKEYEGTVIIGAFVTTPMRFFAVKREIRSVEDFKGMKVHTAGGMMSDVAVSLGMVPVVQPPTTAYEVLSGGVVDSIIFTSDGIVSFKLEKLIRNALLVPGGLSSAAGFLVMNPDKYKALGPELQAILRKTTGENFARIVGRLWDQKDARGIEALGKEGAHVSNADPKLREAIFARTDTAIGAWLKEVQDKRGMDGRKLLDSYRADIRSIEAEIRQRK